MRTFTFEHAGQTYRRTSHRHYTHAVLPVYTTRTRWVPSDNSVHQGLSVPVYDPCEPWYGTPQFCGSLALAQKAAKPGWVIVPLTNE